jgi:D-aminopeptidase
MSKKLKSVLVVADIEGSSGCWTSEAARFITREWYVACVEMSRDVNSVVTGLFDAGVVEVTVHDFHRTGYNILSELLDPRARLVSGYRHGPVPGIGHPGNTEAVLFLGMHAGSGSSGFLAHTLTSRIARLEVNGKAISEVELFSASLAPYGVKPIFFSGCPVACAQAKAAVGAIACHPIDKTRGRQGFDIEAWRAGLKRAAVESLGNVVAKPYVLTGPFDVVVTMRDGEKPARKIAVRWGYGCDGARISFRTLDFHELYGNLIRLCFLTPLVEKILPLAHLLHRFRGRFGLAMVRRAIPEQHRRHHL